MAVLAPRDSGAVGLADRNAGIEYNRSGISSVFSSKIKDKNGPFYNGQSGLKTKMFIICWFQDLGYSSLRLFI
jgi:hypothetical protein